MNEEEIDRLTKELIEGWEETTQQVDKALSSIPEEANAVLVFSALTERAARVAIYFDMDEKTFVEFSGQAYRTAVRNILEEEEVH